MTIICTGENFQQLCDVYCGSNFNLNRNPKIRIEIQKHCDLNKLEECWYNPALIFCYSSDLTLFINKIHLFLNEFVLVSHNEDTHITEKYMILANHKLVIHWFAHNLCMEHPKLTMIPIGIANSMWNHGNINILNENMLSLCEKTDLLYFYFNVSTNFDTRNNCKNILERKGFKFDNQLPFNEYLKKLGTHKFAICPEDNGIDCHRTWECLYLNVVPILCDNILTRNIAKYLPVMLIKSWDNFNESKMNEFDINLCNKSEYLDLNYHKNLILSKMPFNVIYCFIGELPKYIIDTIYQLRLFYDGPVYIILSDLSNKNVDILINKYNIICVDYLDVIDNDFNDVVNKCYHKFAIVNNLTGREKLFIYSFERFFVLHNLMKQKNLQNVLFLELDNLIYDDPRLWLEGFRKSEFTFMFDNTDRCSSGISYIKNFSSIASFLTECKEYILHSNKFLNEMSVLYLYWEKNKNTTLLLPIHWNDKSVPLESHEHYDMFKKTIFDAASIGIYIGGMDPYHTNGIVIKGLKGKWSKIDYTHYQYKWESDSNNRIIPYVLGPNDEWIKINNLHIHSKQLINNLSIPY